MSDAGLQSGDAHERRLLAGVVAGDRRAFDQLFFAYHPRLLRFAARMVRCEDLAEEIVNDVMLVVWRSASRFAARSRVSTWIFGIAYRVALKSLRKRRVRSWLTHSDAIVDMTGVEGGYALADEQQWLRRGFDRLSPQHRAVVELCYFGGYSYAEIAEVVGCPENTVKTRMFHARKHLKRALGELSGRRTSERAAERS